MLQSLPVSIGVFLIAAMVIAIVGTRMARVSDRLADRTGLGKAIMGAVFLGGARLYRGLLPR